jgi:hypothetical protein
MGGSRFGKAHNAQISKGIVRKVYPGSKWIGFSIVHRLLNYLHVIVILFSGHYYWLLMMIFVVLVSLMGFCHYFLVFIGFNGELLLKLNLTLLALIGCLVKMIPGL